MKIAIPDLISNSYFPAAAAVELGMFKDEGLDMELELIFPVRFLFVASGLIIDKVFCIFIISPKKYFKSYNQIF